MSFKKKRQSVYFLYKTGQVDGIYFAQETVLKSIESPYI